MTPTKLNLKISTLLVATSLSVFLASSTLAKDSNENSSIGTAKRLVDEIIECSKASKGPISYGKQKELLVALVKNKVFAIEALCQAIKKNHDHKELKVLSNYLLVMARYKETKVSKKSIDTVCSAIQSRHESDLPYEETTIKKNLVLALADIGQNSDQARDTLLKVIDDESSPVIKIYTAGSLAKVIANMPESKQTKATSLFLNMLKSDSPEMRKAGAEGLRVCKSDEDATVAALKKGLNDNYFKVRLASAYAMRDLGPEAKSAIDILAKTAETESQYNIRAYCIHALGSIGRDDPEMVKRFVKYLDNDELKMTTLSHFKGFGSTGAFAAPEIAAFLKDNDITKRQYAAYCLGHLNNPAVIPDLEAALKDNDPSVRRGAELSIAKLKLAK